VELAVFVAAECGEELGLQGLGVGVGVGLALVDFVRVVETQVFSGRLVGD
jgi:hypothetical protein